MKKPGKAQVAMEFILLMAFAALLLMSLLLILNKISSDNQSRRTQSAVEDLGISIKNELATASEMEKGYSRQIDLPKKINGKDYSMDIEEGSSGNSYLLVKLNSTEMYFSIPKTSGTIQPGMNLIVKKENLTVVPIS